MAKKDNPMFVAVVSPKGEASFPWLSRADTRYNEEGTYKVDLSLPFEEAADFIARLELIRDEYIQENLSAAQRRALTAKPVFIEEVTRPDRDATDEEKEAFIPEPTGNVLFRFKMNRIVHPKNKPAFTQQPILVRADTGEAVVDPIGHGSIIRVKGQVVPYTNAAAGSVGISLRLKTVQVHEFREGSGGNFWTDFGEDD